MLFLARKNQLLWKIKNSIKEHSTVLKGRSYEIAKNCKHDGYQTALASMVYKFDDKKIGSGVSVN